MTDNSIPCYYTPVPPQSIGDDGSPSDSILQDTKRVLSLLQDDRHLLAETLLQTVETRLQKQILVQVTTPSNKRKQVSSEAQLTQTILDQNTSKLEQLRHRCRIFRQAQTNFDTKGWTKASTHFGIMTFYRRETDGSLSIQMQGTLQGVPLFEQVAVLRDVSRHALWVPFCTYSQTVAHLDRLDLVGHFVTGLPGLSRDGLFRVIGCDNVSVDNTILLAGRGLEDTTNPQGDLYLTTGLPADLQLPISKTGRMTIRTFETAVEVLSPTACSTRMVANINPNYRFLSQSIIDFCLKHLAGVMLSKLQGAAVQVAAQPHGPHAVEMRRDAAFYRDWLWPKFQAYADEKGWTMPAVAALQVDGYMEEEEEEEAVDVLGRNVSDDISEITHKSSRSWRSAVSDFRRRRKDRQEAEKQAKVAESRALVAKLIQPRVLNAQKKQRLIQLLQHKRQNVRQSTTSWQYGLQAIVWLLALAVLVQPKAEWFQELPHRHVWQEHVWVQRTGTVVYTLVCAVVHALLCRASILAFVESLDLATKVGRSLAAFFSVNVTVVCLLASMALFGLGVLRATLQALLVWAGRQASETIWFEYLGSVGSSMEWFLTSASEVLLSSWLAVKAILEPVVGILIRIQDSTPMGHAPIRILNMVTKSGWQIVTGVLSGIWRAIVTTTGKDLDWHECVFGAVRFLLTQSAIFVLLSLSLFHFYGSSNKEKDKAPEIESIAVATTTTISASTDRYPITQPTPVPFHDDTSALTMNTAKKRRFRLRRRRKE